MGRLTYQNLETLEAGQRVHYTAGLGGHLVEATATVVNIGTSKVIIRLALIHKRGGMVTYREGDEITANLHELELI